MKMQKIFKQSFVEKLKNNINPEKYKKHIFKFDEDETLLSSCIKAPLDLSRKVDPKDDYKTAIALYEAYPDLERIDVADERFWTYLAHVDLYPYMTKRWPKVYKNIDGTNPIDYINYHWFMKSTAQNNQLRHGLAGLWWGVKLTIDEERENKYELTEILLGRQMDPLRRHLGTSKLARHKEAVIGILEFIKENPDLFDNHFEPRFRYVSKHLNSVGGVKCISYFERDFFKKELSKVSDKIMVTKR